jgi:hypothetical protein
VPTCSAALARPRELLEVVLRSGKEVLRGGLASWFGQRGSCELVWAARKVLWCRLPWRKKMYAGMVFDEMPATFLFFLYFDAVLAVQQRVA